MRGKRVLPNRAEDIEAELFHLGVDEDFHGLRPDREVGKEQLVPAATIGEDVVLEPLQRPQRQSGRGYVRLRSRRGHSVRRRHSRNGLQIQRGRGVSEGEGLRTSKEMDENQEEEEMYRRNLPSRSASPRRGSKEDNHQARRVRGRRHVEQPLHFPEELSVQESEEEATSSESYSLQSASDGSY